MKIKKISSESIKLHENTEVKFKIAGNTSWHLHSIGGEKTFKYAPKLLPIYAHRYMPMVTDKNPPIISVHDIDVIYYGKDIEDYFDIEFGEKNRVQ